MLVNDNRIPRHYQTAFKHPVTVKIYIASAGHLRRVNACNVLHAIYKCDSLRFQNQSLTQLGNIVFELTVGKLRATEPPNGLMFILDNFAIGPYITQFNANFEIATLKGFAMQMFYKYLSPEPYTLQCVLSI